MDRGSLTWPADNVALRNEPACSSDSTRAVAGWVMPTSRVSSVNGTPVQAAE